jgi:hypothetical protein
MWDKPSAMDSNDLDRHSPLAREDRDQIDRLLVTVRAVLGDDLIGAYLHGSAVFDGLRPASDIESSSFAHTPRPARRSNYSWTTSSPSQDRAQRGTSN